MNSESQNWGAPARVLHGSRDRGYTSWVIGMMLVGSGVGPGPGHDVLAQCGDPGTGGCCDPLNGTPWCNEAECCEGVCIIDPFCCDVAWDAFCALEAIFLCRVCDGACGFLAGSCCDANGTYGCDDIPCCAVVCQIEPSCCSTDWVKTCAELAAELCDACPVEPIPTVSQWGLIVMALVLLAGGGIILARRGHPTAEPPGWWTTPHSPPPQR